VRIQLIVPLLECQPWQRFSKKSATTSYRKEPRLFYMLLGSAAAVASAAACPQPHHHKASQSQTQASIWILDAHFLLLLDK
jgi:hypothetical protein